MKIGQYRIEWAIYHILKIYQKLKLEHKINRQPLEKLHPGLGIMQRSKWLFIFNEYPSMRAVSPAYEYVLQSAEGVLLPLSL